MFCKAEAHPDLLTPAPPPWFVLSATTVQDAYCISMAGAAECEGYCRMWEVSAIRWAELCPDGSRQGAVHLHGPSPTTSWRSMSTFLLSSLPTCSPFWVTYAELVPRGWHKASLSYARSRYASLLGEMLSQVGRGGSRERRRGICCTFSAPATPVPDVLVTGQSAAFSWWDRVARGKLLGVWDCQHCKDEGYYGLQRPVSPSVNLSAVYPFPLLHLEFPLTGRLGTQL